ncbi:helix-turn-helix domain-containing protein [Mycobacteroides abscessus]|uniref:helix-turn-helix domain-containing protein n=1 Tax=Mycobacteroides abscessus TaxID=36809 RepID=UPI0026706752|nr:helix-turn-helix transcriptional regulator [Mycobacteroides abscessus]MDO3109836.1 helix-turn-helix transcriptional regulator [Mycobacteroides abscessus subsp. abscessus]
MNTHHVQQVADTLRQHWEALGFSANRVARRAGINPSTYWRIEAGQIPKPDTDSLLAIATALDIPTADLFAASGWLPDSELPSLRPYLRTKYHLPPEALTKLEASVTAIAGEYGISIGHGPARGEDERPAKRIPIQYR